MITRSTPRFSSLLGVALVSAPLLFSPVAQAQNKDPVKIGIMQSFTGAFASTAVSYRAGMRVAVNEINQAGGLLGRRVEIIEADDGLNPAQALSEAKRLVRDGATFVVGPAASHLTLAVGPTFNDAKMVFISSTVAVAPTPYNFSIQMSGLTQAQSMLAFAQDVLKAKSIGVISDSGNVGTVLTENVKKLAPAMNLKVTDIEIHELNASDMTPQILNLRRANPDVIIHSTSLPADAGRFMKNLEEVGWSPLVVSTTIGLAYKPVLDVAGPDALKSGHFYGLVQKAYTYCAKDKIGDRPYDKYLAKLKASEPADYDKLDKNASLGYYDAIMMLRAAVEGTKSFDGTAISAWIERNGSQFRGAAGYPLSPSASSHFFIGPNAITFVPRPDIVRPEDKLTERHVDC